VGKKDDDGMTIHKVIIYDHRSKSGNGNLTVAEDGKMELTKDKRFLVFSLHNGCNYNDVSENQQNRNNRQFQRLKFKDQYRRFDLASFTMTRTNEEFFKDNFQMMNSRQLDSASGALKIELVKKKEAYAKGFTNSFYFYKNIDSVIFKKPDTLAKLKSNFLDNFSKADQKIIISNAINSARNMKESITFQVSDTDVRSKQISRHEIEWHRKYTLSIACLLFFFIGAPLGAIIRKGGLGLPVVISVLFFVVYHVISMTGEKFVREGASQAYVGMWVAAAVYLPIGVFLTYKATTDSVIFDPTIYFRVFAKVFKKKK
ncbi:MAG: LptF/LptG family permease, partial [Bacteroidetes bacterium]|nr:LptF/LptG family permease [Bacteroidota bacterium]